FHPLRYDSRESAECVRRCGTDRKGRTGLSHPGQHGPRHNRCGGKAGQFITRNGGDRRDQDWPAPIDGISAESITQLYKGKPERAMSNSLIYKIFIGSHSRRYHNHSCSVRLSQRSMFWGLPFVEITVFSQGPGPSASRTKAFSFTP